MNTIKLRDMMIAAGIGGINNLTTEYLTDLHNAGCHELSIRQLDLMRIANKAGLPEAPARMAWIISSEVNDYGKSSTFISLDGHDGDLVITADTIEFIPMRGGVNWGAAS